MTVTFVALLTDPAVTCVLAEVWPASTVRFDGTGNALDGLALKATDAPPYGAGEFRFTVSVALVPLFTVLGDTPTEVNVGGVQFPIDAVNELPDAAWKFGSSTIDVPA